MCPIIPPCLGIPTTSLLPEDESEEETSETFDEFPYCQIIIGLINIENSAALCAPCHMRLRGAARDEWVTCVKHLLVIGDVPTGVLCSVCNINHLSATRDEPSCYHCRTTYLRYINGNETYRTDSDGNKVITIFHSVDESLEQYREYME